MFPFIVIQLACRPCTIEAIKSPTAHLQVGKDIQHLCDATKPTTVNKQSFEQEVGTQAKQINLLRMQEVL